MTDEAVLRKHALLDYTYDMEYQEKVLKNPDITPEKKERCEKRIEEDKKWIARLNSLERLDDGSYAGFDKAVGKAGTEYKLADGSSYFIGDVSANDLTLTTPAEAIQANDGTQLARYLAGFDKAVGKAGQTIEVVAQ